MVVSFLERRCGSSATADDVAAAAFERAWRSLDSFNGSDERFRSWIVRIAANELASTFRSDARRSTRDERAVRSAQRLAPPADPQERSIDISDLDVDDLRDALGQLSVAHQDVIMFRFFADLTPSEVADALNISPGNVNVRLHRALAALRGVLEVSNDSGGAQ